MDPNNVKSKPLHNNAKAENLKSKIDLLIMNKTKTLPPGPDNAEENIQSIQEEINNLFTGRLNVGVTPNTPAVDVKKSNGPKLPMSPSKPGDFHMNHGTTVENVEHLLETMFQDSKNTPVKANMFPGNANSKTNTFPTTAHSNRPNTLLNATNTNSSKNTIISNTTIPDSKNVEHLLETMFQDTKATPQKQNSKPTDLKQNVETLLENMFQEESSPRHSTRKSSTPTPRSSLSVEAIENILRTPSPENEEDENAVKPSTRFNTNNPSRINHQSSSPRLNNNTRQSTRSGRLRKRSSQSTLSSHDDSSNDSTKLEIVDESLNRSESLNSSNVSNSNNPDSTSCNLTNQNSRKREKFLNRDMESENGRPVMSTSNNQVNEPSTVKQEFPSPSPNTKASVKEHGSPQPTAKNSKASVKEHGSPQPTANNSKAFVKAIASPQTRQSPVKNPRSSIVTVESELEKMFAGIVKEEEDLNGDEKVLDVKKENGWVDASPGSKRNSQSKRRRSSEFFVSSPEPSTSATPPKQKKKTKQSLAKMGAAKKKGSQSTARRHSLNAKDTSNDSLNVSAKTSGVSKVSPFVRLYTSSKKTVVVNSVAKEEAVPSGTQTKKPADFVPNKKMQSSAQSNLQPANRTDVVDPSWFCVYCKQGPNKHGPAGNSLGDLYGPYRIGAPQEGYLDGDDFKRRVARSPGKSETSKKKRTISSDVDPSRLTAGLTRVTSESTNASWDAATKSSSVQYEVWFHEACIAWASGVCLVQGSLLGLDESVWAALNSFCVNCGETGASIGCVKSKCRASVHYSCALHIGWYLDPTTFVATCSVHREKYVPDRYLETPGNDLLL